MISVIIVNYNAGHLLIRCIQSVLASALTAKVLVSDNGSTDNSLQMLRENISDPRLTIIENGMNFGFSKANNRALPLASTEYILFLNPDCNVSPNVLENLHELMQSRPDVGMSGCLIKNQDGTEQAGCRRSMPTPIKSLMRALGISKLWPKLFKDFVLNTEPLPDSPVEVDAISGAFMFVRRVALLRVGPWDESYFLHCEDLDWCMRFHLCGYKILFVPDISVVHIKGVCSQERALFVSWHMHKGMMRFYYKFFRQQYPVVLLGGVFLAVWFRFIVISLVTMMRTIFIRMRRVVFHES